MDTTITLDLPSKYIGGIKTVERKNWTEHHIWSGAIASTHIWENRPIEIKMTYPQSQWICGREGIKSQHS